MLSSSTGDDAPSSMSQAEVDISDVHELASLLQTGKMSDVEVLLQQISEVFV